MVISKLIDTLTQIGCDFQECTLPPPRLAERHPQHVSWQGALMRSSLDHLQKGHFGVHYRMHPPHILGTSRKS